MLSFNNILVHYDTRAETHPALDFAAETAKANDGKLTLLEMTPDSPWPVWPLVGGYERVIEEITHTKAKLLDTVAAPLRAQGISVTTKVLDGRTSVAMIREVLRNDHDLIVKQAKGQHSRRAGFFGTTAQRLLRKCPCPVLIVKPNRARSNQRVVAAVSSIPQDELHTALNREIIRLAMEAAADGVPDIVTAWGIYGESVLKNHMKEEEWTALQDGTHSHAERALDDLLKELGMGVGQRNIHVSRGEADEIICQFIREHETDLLVMGTIGRSSLAGLLMGNTAEQILERVECSVLAVKPEGFVSPIQL